MTDYHPARYWEARAKGQTSDPDKIIATYQTLDTAGPSTEMKVRRLQRDRVRAHAQAYGWKTLLDCGCGTGTWFPLWDELGLEFSGVDFAPSALPAAERVAQGLGREVPLLCEDLVELPLADQAFDVALCVRALTHVPTLRAVGALHELSRVARHVMLVEYLAAPGAKLAAHVFSHDYEELLEASGFKLLHDERYDGLGVFVAQSTRTPRTTAAEEPSGGPAEKPRWAWGPVDIAKDDASYWLDEGDKSLAKSEGSMHKEWDELVFPFLEPHVAEIDWSTTLDVGSGLGRNVPKLLKYADTVVASDVVVSNVDHAAERFGDDDRVRVHYADGATLHGIGDRSISFVYCFNSMAHFDTEVVLSYIKEFSRVLVPGGYGFCHHSNLTSNPGGHFSENPGWRNFMSKELFAHLLMRYGFEVLKQELVSWRAPELDCCSLFRLKPAGA